jgi:ribokinase
MTPGSRNQSGTILSLGSINADFQVRIARRPAVSESLPGSDFRRFGGGKAANVAYLARRFGHAVRLFGHVGDDDLAWQALAPLRDIGVDLSGIKQVAGNATGVAMVMVPPDGKKGIVMAANANEAWTANDAADIVREINTTPPNAVLVLDCEIPVFVLERAVAAAGRRGLITVLDPSPADKVSDRLIAGAGLVVPNAAEAERLTGLRCDDVDSAIHAGTRLLERGASGACIKLSDGGCVLVENEKVTHIGAVPVEVVDTTGAGDAFAGALAVALAEQHPLVYAVRFAVAATHLAVTGYGSQTALPVREQIQRIFNRLPVSDSVAVH